MKTYKKTIQEIKTDFWASFSEGTYHPLMCIFSIIVSSPILLVKFIIHLIKNDKNEI